MIVEPTSFLVGWGLGFALGLVVMAGLWIGQRGRNADLRELTRLQLERDRPEPRAYIRDPGTGEMVPVQGDTAKDEPLLRDEERERLVEDVMEGSRLTKRQAEEHVDELLKQTASLGYGG